VTVQIPERLYTRLKQRADRAQRSVESEVLEILATAAPAAEEFPADLAQAWHRWLCRMMPRYGKRPVSV